MISAFDLRKGNLVLYQNDICSVTQIIWNNVEVEKKERGKSVYHTCPYNDIEPILVTPEEILKCGFIQHERFPHRDVFHMPDHHFIVNILRDTSEVSFGLDGTVALIRKGDIFLHQLQNLFFFLTHEELQYNHL